MSRDMVLPFADTLPTTDSLEPRWHVLHTLARQEKALARDLESLAIEHYLPTQPSVRYYGKRKIRFDLPVFAGYLFLRGTLDQAYRADRTGRVARLISVSDQARIERELAQIRLALQAGVALTPCAMLAPGAMVRVRYGPLSGMVGEIEEHGRANRLILRVRTLGQAVSLDIEADLLEPVESGIAA